MHRLQIARAFLLLLLLNVFLSEVCWAQLNARRINYIVPTPRVKAKKYIYQIETRQLSQGQFGQLLPSQVTLRKKQAMTGDRSSIGLKEKSKTQIRRSIASE
jgi:hypothetical protein